MQNDCGYGKQWNTNQALVEIRHKRKLQLAHSTTKLEL